MSDKQKSYAKVIGAILALLGGMEGADLAGYTMDFDQAAGLLKGSSPLLILYLHFCVRPLLVQLVDDFKAWRVARAGGSQSPPDEVEVEAEEPPKRRAATHPGLKVIKPAREP